MGVYCSYYARTIPGYKQKNKGVGVHYTPATAPEAYTTAGRIDNSLPRHHYRPFALRVSPAIGEGSFFSPEGIPRVAESRKSNALTTPTYWTEQSSTSHHPCVRLQALYAQPHGHYTKNEREGKRDPNPEATPFWDASPSVSPVTSSRTVSSSENATRSCQHPRSNTLFWYVLGLSPSLPNLVPRY